MSTFNLAKKISKKFSILTIALGFFASGSQAEQGYQCACKYIEIETNKSILDGNEHGIPPYIKLAIGQAYPWSVKELSLGATNKNGAKNCLASCVSLLNSEYFASGSVVQSAKIAEFRNLVQATVDKTLNVYTYHKSDSAQNYKETFSTTSATLRSHLCGLKTALYVQGTIYGDVEGSVGSVASLNTIQKFCYKFDIK